MSVDQGFTRRDRLGLTTFGAVLAHLVIVLGVSFTVPKVNSEEPLPTLEITLVNTKSDKAPDDADYLAQASQEGGGEHDKPNIARSPLPAETTPATTAPIPVAKLASAAVPPQPAPIPKPLTQHQETAPKIVSEQSQKARPQQKETKTGLVQDPKINADRARLSAEISRFWEEYQKRPRRKFLSARTKEFKYATYMDAWRKKVERVGNINYPEQAKQRRLSGAVVLDVEIKPDGSVLAVSIIRPSGHKVLDDAAVRSVRLAAPYDPFPPDIRKEVDIMHITRTWQYARTTLSMNQ